MPVDLVVPDDCPPMRLDQFVARQLAEVSRRRLRQAEILLNGRPAKHGVLVHAGDRVTVPTEPEPSGELAPNPRLALRVLYEDADLVAVDKRPGMASVALRSDESDTVANFLLAALPEVRTAGGPLEGGLVHRLDHDTSGVLVAARSAAAYAQLRQQFSAHRVEKDYLALVWGEVAKSGRIDTPIAHDPRRETRMLVCEDPAAVGRLGARPASTRFKPVLHYGEATLVRVTMRSGVRHQVRLHLASIGHPIVGDRLYGRPPSRREWIARQALHASRIVVVHPRSGESLALESPLPQDFEAALLRFKGQR